MTLDVHNTVRRPESLPFLVRLWLVARGLWAVLRLLATALAELLSAVLGVRPGLTRTVGHVIADEYRAGCAGAVDADVIEDQEGQQ